MTSDNELEFLKRRMEAATPAPDPGRRAENIARAMENFERHQGAGTAPRQSMDRPQKGFLAGVLTMLTTRSAAALTATTALVAGVLVLMSPFDATQRPDEFRYAPQEITASELGTRSTEAAAAPGPEIAAEPVDRAPAQLADAEATESASVLAPRGEMMPLETPSIMGAPSEPQPAPPAPAPQIAAPAAPQPSGPGIALSGSAEMGIAGGGEVLREAEPSPASASQAHIAPSEQRAELEARLAQTQSELVALQEAQERMAATGEGTSSTLLAEQSTAQDERRLQELQRELDEARTIYSETAPHVIELQDRIESLAGEISARNGEESAVLYQQLRIEAEVGRLHREIAMIETELRESFPEADPNPLQVTLENPVSTFSIDVDTASYALLRSSLNRGQLPVADAVRIEEMVNYFSYDYPAPGPEAEAPFQPSFTVFQTPWNPDTQLVHIALQGEMPAIEDRPPLNLVFLIDVSGSMDSPDKLPLLIQSFRLMLDRLDPQDQVAIVTYAGHTGVALDPTSASDRSTIEEALTALRAGGSTNGVGGLQAAYALAEDMAEDGEVSRVILATDGDFNVGISDPGQLADVIAEERESGTYLSVLGFGRGNLQDATMQALAQNGNGTAAYIDTLHEAQRVLVDQLSGALFPIADDVKVQVEFNPARVAEYRLIGYETRALEREDFNNDAVDAGELGAGHRVTAIYEITPVGSPAIRTDPLRYGAAEPLPAQAESRADEIGFLRLRWKEPGEDTSQLMDFPITETDGPSGEVLFATAIAGFGQLLQGSDYLGGWGYADAIALAGDNLGADAFGLRREAVQLMRLADSLDRAR